VLPGFKPPSSYPQSPYLKMLAQAQSGVGPAGPSGAAGGSAEQQAQPGTEKRDILCFFRGDVGKRRLPNYSRGIRQKLYEVGQMCSISPSTSSTAQTRCAR
jgi:hypothetical protein